MRTALLLLLLPLSTACASKDDTSPPEILDPSQRQYGLTYAEWAIAWTEYTQGYSNRWAAPACIAPVADPTGAHCRDYQDASSPVFFLVGANGTVRREECVAPKGKALFFPLLSVSADDTPDYSLTNDDLRHYVEGAFDLMKAGSLHLSVDGQAMGDLERGGVRSAPFTVDVPPAPNRYSCADPMHDPNVHGEFSGYAGGYWALIPPPSPGKHHIEFGGIAEGTPLEKGTFTIDATYDLVVGE